MAVITPFPRSVRLHGKTPRVEVPRHSYPILLRDAIMARVKAMPFFTGFTFTTNKALQIQPQSLPYCGVYFIQETSTPDGDANAGEVRFRTAVIIGFSVIILNNDAEAAELKLDTAMQTLAGNLLNDETLYNGDQVKVQGFVSGKRSHEFGNGTFDNKTPIAELRWELICDIGTITYPPVVLDDLEVIHVTTEYPYPPTGAPPVYSEYDMEQ
jgi:hypothetical protein